MARQLPNTLSKLAPRRKKSSGRRSGGERGSKHLSVVDSSALINTAAEHRLQTNAPSWNPFRNSTYVNAMSEEAIQKPSRIKVAANKDHIQVWDGCGY